MLAAINSTKLIFHGASHLRNQTSVECSENRWRFDDVIDRVESCNKGCCVWGEATGGCRIIPYKGYLISQGLKILIDIRVLIETLESSPSNIGLRALVTVDCSDGKRGSQSMVSRRILYKASTIVIPSSSSKTVLRHC